MGATRETMIVFRSHWEAIRVLEPTEQVEVYNAIFGYGMDGVVPTALSATGRMIFRLVKPQIDANIEKYMLRVRGGTAGA